MKVLIKTGLFDDDYPEFVLPLVGLPTKDVESIDEVVRVVSIDTPEISEKTSSVLVSSIEEDEPTKDFLKETAYLEQLRADTYQDAYKEGYAEGLSVVKVKYDEAFDKVSNLIAEINNVLPNYLKEHEYVIAAVVFEAVCKVIGTELADKERLAAVVTHTIEGIDREKIREVYISQNDYNTIENLNNAVSSDGLGIKNRIDPLLFKVDQTIQLGGCKVRLEDKFLDATIDSQLMLLSKSLAAKATNLAQ